MKEKNKDAVAIIGGADGPTSIFIAGRTGKRPLKVRIQNVIFKCRRRMAERKVAAGTHALEEAAAYAMKKYGLTEMDTDGRGYRERRKSLKEGLILQYKPELLGEMKDIPKPDVSSEESVQEFFDKIKARSKMIEEMPDHVIPMDFHLYEMKSGDASFELEMDYIWEIFAVSYSGNRKTMKRFKKISRDLYLYYGVSEDDIRNRTERYSALITVLSS